MPTAESVIFGAVVPFMVTALIVLFVARQRRSKTPGLWQRMAWPIGMAIGFLAGFVGLEGWCYLQLTDAPDWPARYWFPWLAALATGAGAIELAETKHGWLRWSVRLLLCAATPALLLYNATYIAIDSTDSYGRAVAGALCWYSGCGLALFAVWTLATNQRGEGDFVRPLVLLVSTGAAAVVIMMSGSSIYGQILGTLSMVIFAGLVVTWPRGGWESVGGSVPIVILIFGGMLISSYHYSDLTWPNAILLGLCILPASTWPSLSISSKIKAWQRAAFRLVPTMVLAGTAVGIAAVKFAQDMAPPSSGSYP